VLVLLFFKYFVSIKDYFTFFVLKDNKTYKKLYLIYLEKYS